MSDVSRSEFDALLKPYADCFHGYGTYTAPFWFVGIEEGGGDGQEEVVRKFRCWAQRGRKELDDLCELHDCIGKTRWCRGQQATSSGVAVRRKPRLQSTWASLIRVLLAAKGRSFDNESVREYQAKALGRQDGETCVIELLPVPSQSWDRWRYADWSAFPFMQSKKTYYQHYAPIRGAHIREQATKYRPCLVFMYGVAEFAQTEWRRISGVGLKKHRSAGYTFEVGSNGGTVFVVSRHPTSPGTPNQYFIDIGIYLRGFMNGQCGRSR